MYVFGWLLIKSGADLGGRGGGGRTPPPPQGFDPLPTQRVRPLILFRNPSLADRPLNFSKGAIGANIYYL